VYPEDLQEAESFYRRVASGGEEKEIEYRMLHANGNVVWVRDWVHKSSENPRSPVLQGFMFDVSERVNARMELQRYREHLENVVDERTAELLAVNQELQSFAHSLSQDLRVPLRVINGFSQAMLEDYADVVDAEGKKNLKRICHGAEEMGKMIDDILILSRVTRQELYRREINLSDIAENIVAELKEKNSEAHVQYSIKKNVLAYGDPEFLTIVLEHLLKNAWKFTAHEQEPRVEFSSKTVDGKVIYFVRDNGAGFDMQYAEKLFLPFRRLHNTEEFSGAGIGLATVKRIILRHGGEMWGEGEVGKGATFYFTLAKSSTEMMISEKRL
jgi:light-regulated signal transduction histidine kinase (bacteriophytochrome)